MGQPCSCRDNRFANKSRSTSNLDTGEQLNSYVFSIVVGQVQYMTCIFLLVVVV